MNVTIEDAGVCRKQLQIEWPTDRVDAEYAKSLKEYASVARIKGFRPGKAPLKMVENRYAKNILEDIRDRLVAEGYQAALKDNELQVVHIVDLKEPTAEPGSPLSFSVTVEVAPDFDLPSYEGIQLKREPIEIDEAKVDETIQGIAEQFASFEEVEGRSVERGDLVQVDYEGVVEGTSIEELGEETKGLGKRDDFWVRADENAFLPEFGDGLVGLDIGAKHQILVDFPADFSAEALAGKKATYFVTVKGIRAKNVPEVDAAFLERLGVEGEDDLREKIREDLKASATQRETERLRNELVDQLLKQVKCDLPETVVSGEARGIMQDILRDNASRGVPQDQLMEKKDEILEVANRNAEGRVKAQFVLDRIADREKITVSASELDSHIGLLARRYGMKPDEFRQELKKRDAMSGVEKELRRSMTIDHLMEKANISES